MKPEIQNIIPAAPGWEIAIEYHDPELRVQHRIACPIISWMQIDAGIYPVFVDRDCGVIVGIDKNIKTFLGVREYQVKYRRDGQACSRVTDMPVNQQVPNGISESEWSMMQRAEKQCRHV